jgi:hypothetical protein
MLLPLLLLLLLLMLLLMLLCRIGEHRGAPLHPPPRRLGRKWAAA